MSGDGRAPQDIWASLTQAERDTAYNNNTAVEDSAALIAARDVAAAAFRAAHPAHLDLRYGPDPRHAVDLYRAEAADAPWLVFIHGGYWQRNSRESFAHYAEGFLALGWSVAMPSYRLAPQASLEEIVADIGAALDWLAAGGGGRGFDGGTVLLAGWSAGAQLAVMHLDHPSVTAALAISGIYDLAPLRDTFLNAALNLTDAEIAALSPLRRPASRKPLAIAYGADELPALVRDSAALHALRTDSGASGPLVPVAGMNHFTVLDALRRKDSVLVRAAQALVPVS